MNRCVLEDVEGVGDLPFADAPRSKRLGQVRAAAAVTFDAVVEPVAAVIAHRSDHVVTSDVVAEDLEHRPAPVALELVSDQEVQSKRGGACVGGRQPLASVLRCECDDVRHLLPFDVDDLQELALRDWKGASVPAGDKDLRGAARDCRHGDSLTGRVCLSMVDGVSNTKCRGGPVPGVVPEGQTYEG